MQEPSCTPYVVRLYFTDDVRDDEYAIERTDTDGVDLWNAAAVEYIALMAYTMTGHYGDPQIIAGPSTTEVAAECLEQVLTSHAPPPDHIPQHGRQSRDEP